MKHLDTLEQKIVLSLLMLTWMSMVFFIEFSIRYEVSAQVSHLQQLQGDTNLKRLKVRPQCGAYDCLSGLEFVALFDKHEEQQLSFTLLEMSIFDELGADEYLKQFAEGRGYRTRRFVDEQRLVSFSGYRTLPEVRDAYISLRDEMLREGIALHFVSGYRSFDEQKELFLEILPEVDPLLLSEGTYDAELTTVFERSALPGYSKHHTGYAVDFGCGEDYLVFEFAETDCYQWMSENNFERIKKYGFIPSYPNDVAYQGPQPEPWEYVWVDPTLL